MGNSPTKILSPKVAETDFHHGSSTRFAEPSDSEMWFQVTKTNNKNKNFKTKKASMSELMSNASAPKGHIATKSVTPHPGLYQTMKKVNTAKQDKKTKKNKKNYKKTRRTHRKRTKKSTTIKWT